MSTSTPFSLTTLPVNSINSTYTPHPESTSNHSITGSAVMSMNTAYAIAFALTVVCIGGGNIAVVLAIRATTTIHPVTKIFISNLALADVTVGLAGIYHTISELGPAHLMQIRSICLIKNVILIGSYLTSITTLIAIAVERYIAVLKPLEFLKIMTEHKAYMIASCTWVYGLMVALPPLAGLNDWHPGLPCTVFYVLTDVHHHLLAAQILLLLVTVTGAYALLIKTSWKQARNIVKQVPASHQMVSSRRRLNLSLLKTCSIISGLCVLCHVPMVAALIIRSFYTMEELEKDAVFQNLTIIAAWMSLLNSALNPVVYALKMPPLREAMKRVICPPCRHD